MARKLVVEVVGDFDSLNRGFQRTSRNAQRFGNDMSKLGRGTLAASLSFRGLGRSIAFASSTFLGGVGLGLAIKSVVDEMTKQQKVAAQTAAVIKSTGDVSGVTAGHVQDLATQLLNLTGIDDEVIKSGENMLLTFTNIRNVAGKNNDIFDQATKVGLDMATALEGAGFEGGNLQTTMIRLGKALNDPVRGITALRRVGVQFTNDQIKLIKRLVETGHTLEAQKLILAELRKEFGGSAAAAGSTLTGKLDKLRETVKNIAAAIGEQFLPAITRAVDRLLAWVQNTENQKRVMQDIQQVIKAVTDVLSALRTAFEGVDKISGSTKETLKLLLAALVAYKGLQIAGSLSSIASSIGLVGTNAETATGQVAGLRGALAGIAGLGAITVVIELIIHRKQVDNFLDSHGLGFLNKGLIDQPGIKQVVKEEINTHSFPGSLFAFAFKKDTELSGKSIKDTGKKLAAVIRGAIGTATALPPGAVSDTGPTKKELAAIRARLRAAREAFRQAVQDQGELAVDRATLTKTLSDDIAATEKLNALIKRRIAGGHGTIELQRQQIEVERQLADLFQQQAEARKKARDAAQFKRLGFGPTGEDIIPGVKNLKKQLGNIADAVSGSFLDTRKTRSLLAHIRQVLSGGLGSVSSEVRSKIQQILADLKQQLKQSSVDVTRFNKTASGQFVLAGATPRGSGNVTIQGGIHLHGVQNVQQMEEQLAKRRKQRAHARRGTR